jgi:predicted dehydrogenase
MLDVVNDGKVKYDRVCLVNVRTEKGLVGDIAQDVITEPAQKMVRIQGTQGFLEWFVNFDGGNDAVRYWDGENGVKEELIAKTRPDDFRGEIDHLEDILKSGIHAESPMALKRGLDTMLVIAAAHLSQQMRKTVRIDYEKGYSLEALIT